jgi:hypothetical protein
MEFKSIKNYNRYNYGNYESVPLLNNETIMDIELNMAHTNSIKNQLDMLCTFEGKKPEIDITNLFRNKAIKGYNNTQTDIDVLKTQKKVFFYILEEFVDYLDSIYNIPPSLIPFCWISHPKIVVLIYSLYKHYKLCYFTKDTTYTPLDFEEKYRLVYEYLSVITDEHRYCRDKKEHKDPVNNTGQNDRHKFIKEILSKDDNLDIFYNIKIPYTYYYPKNYTYLEENIKPKNKLFTKKKPKKHKKRNDK